MSKSLSSGCFSLVFKIDKSAIFCCVFEMKCECEGRTFVKRQELKGMGPVSVLRFGWENVYFEVAFSGRGEESQQPSQLG